MRTPGSGAFTGGKNFHRVSKLDASHTRVFQGDIAQPEGITLIVECKNYKDLSGGFHAIVNGSSRQLVEWIGEVEFDSKFQVPYLLVFNITNKGMYFVLPTKFFEVVPTLLDKAVPFTYFPIEQEDESVIDYVIVHSGYYEYIASIVDVAIKKEYK